MFVVPTMGFLGFQFGDHYSSKEIGCPRGLFALSDLYGYGSHSCGLGRGAKEKLA